MNTNNKTQKIVMAAMFSALVCVATMIIKIPSPLKGYVNIGDCIVLIVGWLYLPTYGFLAAGIGSALADVFAGYAMYVPATFIIKGTMALIAYYGSEFLRKKVNNVLSQIVSGIVAEAWMVIAYFLFESILYGGGSAAVNIPPNSVQGIVGLILGCILIRVFEKNKISFR